MGLKPKFFALLRGAEEPLFHASEADFMIVPSHPLCLAES